MAKNIAMIAGNMNYSNKSIGALLTDDIIATNNGWWGRIKKIKINFGCNQWSVLGFSPMTWAELPMNQWVQLKIQRLLDSGWGLWEENNTSKTDGKKIPKKSNGPYV